MPPSGVFPFGPKSTAWLADAGIVSLADIEQIGVIAAYRRVKAAHPHQVTLTMLWALQAAVLGIQWNQIPPEMKATLKAELAQAERDTPLPPA